MRGALTPSSLALSEQWQFSQLPHGLRHVQELGPPWSASCHHPVLSSPPMGLLLQDPVSFILGSSAQHCLGVSRRQGRLAECGRNKASRHVRPHFTGEESKAHSQGPFLRVSSLKSCPFPAQNPGVNHQWRSDKLGWRMAQRGFPKRHFHWGFLERGAQDPAPQRSPGESAHLLPWRSQWRGEGVEWAGMDPTPRPQVHPQADTWLSLLSSLSSALQGPRQPPLSPAFVRPTFCRATSQSCRQALRCLVHQHHLGAAREPGWHGKPECLAQAPVSHSVSLRRSLPHPWPGLSWQVRFIPPSNWVIPLATGKPGGKLRLWEVNLPKGRRHLGRAADPRQVPLRQICALSSGLHCREVRSQTCGALGRLILLVPCLLPAALCDFGSAMVPFWDSLEQP